MHGRGIAGTAKREDDSFEMPVHRPHSICLRAASFFIFVTVVLLSLLSVGTSDAYALSAGCSALNGGFDSSSGGYFGSYSGTGFDAGDTITVNYLHGNAGSTYTINPGLYGPSASSHQYVFSAANAGTVTIDVNNTGYYRVTWSCASGSPSPQTITFPGLSDTAFTATPPTPAATASSGLSVSYSTTTGSVCTVTGGGTISFVSAGTCSITASQAGDSNYAAATPVTQSFAVTQGTNVITFPGLSDRAFTATPPTPAATASSGLSVSYSTTTGSVCTVTGGGTISFVSAGTCSITASQAGDSNYAAATPVTQSFAVTQGTNVITFPGLSDTAFTATPPTPAATASSGLSVSYSTTTGSVCTVTGGGTISFVSAGTCSITASQAGDSNYAAATPVTQSFAVTQGTNVITFPGLSDTAFTATPPTPAATASSGLSVSYSTTTGSVCTVTGGGTISFVSAGTCSITASQAGDSNYAAATPVTQSFAVTQGTNVITFPGLSDTAFTATPPTPAATASSGLSVSYSTTTGSVCTVTGGGTISFVSAGTCSITASQAGDSNYAAATPVTQSFAVTQGTNVITFPGLSDRALGSAPFNLTASASSGLAVSLRSLTPGVCSLSGGTASLLSVGECKVEASQQGNANYRAATSVVRSFMVEKAVTTVALVSSAKSILYGFPVKLTATVTGVSPTGTVSFMDGVSTLATVALAGGTAELTTKALSSGKHSIVARYGGDGSNLAARSGTVTVTVDARPDPSLDPDVIGLVNAQMSAMQRFGQTQIDNIGNRLQQLHNDDDSGPLLNVQTSVAVAGQDNLAGGESDQAGLPKDALAYQSTTPGGSGDPTSAVLSGSSIGNQQSAYHIWTAGSVTFGTSKLSGSVDNSFTTPGVTIGLDTTFIKGVKAGFAVGYGRDKTLIGSDGTRSEGHQVSGAIYASLRLAPDTFLDMIGGYGSGSFDSRRYSSLGGVYLRGRRNASEFFGLAQLSKDIKFGQWTISPFTGVDAVRMTLNSYAETGSSFWALKYDASSSTAVRGNIGLRTRYDVPVSWGRLALTAGASDSIRLTGKYDQALSYADLTGGQLYTIVGEGISSNQLGVNLGVDMTFENFNLGAQYQATAGGGIVTHAVSAHLGFSF